ERMYPTVQSFISLRRFGLPPPPQALTLLRGQTTEAPLPMFSEVAAYSGFVDFPLDDDGTVRVVPLCASFRGKLYPHMILATACAALGVDVKTLRFEQDKITIPVPNDRPIEIPVRSRPSARYGTASMIMDIPWFGQSTAIMMYDPPRFTEPVNHE